MESSDEDTFNLSTNQELMMDSKSMDHHQPRRCGHQFVLHYKLSDQELQRIRCSYRYSSSLYVKHLSVSLGIPAENSVHHKMP